MEKQERAHFHNSTNRWDLIIWPLTDLGACRELYSLCQLEAQVAVGLSAFMIRMQEQQWGFLRPNAGKYTLCHEYIIIIEWEEGKNRAVNTKGTHQGEPDSWNRKVAEDFQIRSSSMGI